MKEKKSNLFLLGILFLCLILSLLSFFHIDSDYYWHLKAGEIIFQKGIIRHDIFSWLAHGKYWMSHEWLFEVIIYGLKCLFGKYHTFIYCFSCYILLFGFLLLTNYKAYLKNFLYTLFYLLFFGISLLGFIQVRAYLISFLLLSITIYLLIDLYHNSESYKIFFLPLITIIWANVHGGSSNLPYLLCFIFFIIGHFSFQFKKIESKRLKKKQLYRYFIVMILCIISVCINIHGIKMLTYPYLNMFDTVMIDHIMEWRSTTLHESFHYVYFAYLLFLLLTFLFSSKKIQLIDFVLFLICTYLGLKSIRFWAFTPIIMSYVIFSYVGKSNNKGFTSSVIILSTFLLFVFLLNDSFSKLNNSKQNISSETISMISKANPKKLFNQYKYGGELIYHDIPVFIDGRADLYSGNYFNDYLSIINLKNNAISLIRKYNFDYYLLSGEDPLYTFISNSEEYELVYNDKNIYFYKKIVN